jgi:hypothetical protein
MKYLVTMAIAGKYQVEVETENEDIEEAKAKATQAYYDADFGDASDIDMEIRTVEPN